MSSVSAMRAERTPFALTAFGGGRDVSALDELGQPNEMTVHVDACVFGLLDVNRTDVVA